MMEPEMNEQSNDNQGDADLPNLVDDKARFVPDAPATEASVDLGNGVTKVNYL